MAKLKVYGGGLHGLWRAIVAATSQKEAVRLIDEQCGGRVSMSYFRDYWCETGNTADIEQAMSEPGTVFMQRNRHGAPWTRWHDRDRER